ncbi:amino acid adenylation domain-containing protein [Neorhizobium huautlense]|uniref:Amino acid adenylation domain-containing protein n=1 Tax=Neorhizobium huautlense TaxID=67774 RepID=A0ABT9PML0_9HYPH|nr:amino acid adenylation domain-containing protein [Neorhizobium huautlense]MDP9835694.1 amino acid adenylation domain-containing protein [Neorhizobium huautlense]
MDAAVPMTLNELRRQMQENRIRLWVADGELRYAAPQGKMTAALRSALGHHKKTLIGELSREAVTITAEPDKRHQPYPMTDLQQAYWVGEHGGYAQSAIPCFFHDCRFDRIEPEVVQQALLRLQTRHEVMTARFLANGTQVVPPPGENPCILAVEDFRALTEDEAEKRLGTLCETYPETLPSLEQGPPLAATLARLADSDRLLIAFRLIAIDGPSLSMIFRDLLRYLFVPQGETETPPLLSHRDYVLALKATSSPESAAYWDRTLKTLPPPPELPLTGHSPQWSRFRRLAGKLEGERWQKLKALAAEHGVTANAAMLALYAAMLRPFATRPDFTLNVLANYRPFSHPEIGEMTGNCSNTSLIDCADGGSFAEQARRIQTLMAERLAHASVSGVSLIRRLQLANETDKPAAPFVFTSGISSGRPSLPAEHTSRFELLGSHLRTPQVWMDHQVIENHQGLIYYWDYVEDIFVDGVPEAVFERYRQTLDRLVNDPSAWQDTDPSGEQAQLSPLVADHPQDRAETLPETFLATAARTPDAVALLSNDETLTYAQLRARAENIATALVNRDAKLGEIAAICLPKGVSQITAVIGVSLAGLVWLPIDSRMPAERRDAILRHSGCRWLIAEKADDLQEGVCHLSPKDFAEASDMPFAAPATQPSDRAYIIYTSGSTGMPKGVVITHGAALNTIRDINRRFGITVDDRILALSALSFDLSVFDIWGALSAGAAIVVPPDSEFPDPAATLAISATHGVTVWNSVPALLDMVLSAAGETPARELQMLRTIMLSGDWIPLTLARKILGDFPEAKLFSLGGATEASIWSNFYPVTKIDPAWKSIPYGFGLSGQQLHVLDTHGRPCPVGVTGEIHIEGFGLAEGYLNDAEKTQASFFIHDSGRRLYRTGDLGRVMPDGAIEFLGRKDFQLKIRGHRIEAGDVETNLIRHPEIDQALVFAMPSADRHPMLAACHTGRPIPATDLKAWLGERLPRYMVPDLIVRVETLPLSANGKRDRKAAAAIVAATKTVVSDETAAPATIAHDLALLADLWANVTGRRPSSPQDDFFQSGGNSLLAVHLSRAIAKTFDVEIGLAAIFRAPTLSGMREAIAAQASITSSAQNRGAAQ